MFPRKFLENSLKVSFFLGFPGHSASAIDRIGGVGAHQEQASRSDIGLRNRPISGNNSYQ
jgi:hypothetical protein